MATPKSRRAKGQLTPKGEHARRRIVVAAARLMFENGVAETTVEQIRDAAGVSNSQVYHYFADKKALVRAVIDYQTDTVVGAQEPMFDQFDTLDGLRRWRDFMVEHQRRTDCRGGCPIGSLASELAEIDDEARVQIATGFRRWEAGIRRGLHAMHAQGRLRPDADPDDLALATLASLQGGLLLTQLHRDPRPVATALDAILALIESHTVPPRGTTRAAG